MHVDRKPASGPEGSSPEEASAGGALPVRRGGLIPAELLDPHAVFVVKRLQREGHEAYLVGGCVRDLLAGLEPKDFDVATDAHPNRIKRLFRSARIIGRRFRLVHIRFPGDRVIETSTFRGDPTQHVPPDDEPAASGRRRDWRSSAENVFGTAPEDANRRDFTINALFYDPVADEVIDWVGGLEDMDTGVVRCIGHPPERIEEDPVRMLRAVHFAQRLDFRIEPALEDAIREHAATLETASQARLYVELVKMLSRGRARGTFQRLHALGVLQVWLPELCAFLDQPVEWPSAAGGTHAEASLGEPLDAPQGHATWNLLAAADRWGLAAHQVPESVALTAVFGPWLMAGWRASGRHGLHAFVEHFDDAFRPVALRMSIPRWASMQLRDILWMLDDLRAPPPLKRAKRMVQRPAFASALAFLELDVMARAGERRPLEHWRELAEQCGVYLGFDRPRAKTPRPRGEKGRRGGRGGRGRGGRRAGRAGSADAPRADAGAARGKADEGPRSPRRRRRRAPEPEAGAWMDPPEA